VPVPRGQRFVAVGVGVCDAIRPIAQALALHQRHDMLTGETHHSGGDAAVAAFRAGAIDQEELTLSRKVYRVAGKAKHNISAPIKRREPVSPTTPTRPSCPRPILGSDSTPGGKLVDDVARAPGADPELLRRLVAAFANLLLRVRMLEKGVSAPSADSFQKVRDVVESVVPDVVGNVVGKVVPGFVGPVVSKLAQEMVTNVGQTVGGLAKDILTCSDDLITRALDRYDTEKSQPLRAHGLTVDRRLDELEMVVPRLEAVIHELRAPALDAVPLDCQEFHNGIDTVEVDPFALMESMCQDADADNVGPYVLMGAPRRGPRCYKFVQPEVPTRRLTSLRCCSLRAVLPLVRSARIQRINEVIPGVPATDPELLQLYADEMREDARNLFPEDLAVFHKFLDTLDLGSDDDA